MDAPQPAKADLAFAPAALARVEEGLLEAHSIPVSNEIPT
jgi:hypothetical protein